MECKECKKELENVPTKRHKEFCNSTCRSKFWQKKKRMEKIKSQIEEESRKLWKESTGWKNPVQVRDLNQEAKARGSVLPENWATMPKFERIKWMKNN